MIEKEEKQRDTYALNEAFHVWEMHFCRNQNSLFVMRNEFRNDDERILLRKLISREDYCHDCSFGGSSCHVCVWHAVLTIILVVMAGESGMLDSNLRRIASLYLLFIVTRLCHSSYVMQVMSLDTWDTKGWTEVNGKWMQVMNDNEYWIHQILCLFSRASSSLMTRYDEWTKGHSVLHSKICFL